ncbi:MAG: DegT/DnrJ/EryC1/StrS family aminotransferase [Bacteroidetes bacterium]|nr:DegT/DnrJ/EryC1/StrS family aminotransferase [Bacteroidota bacterium]
MINVTKTFLPPLNEYIDYLKKIWESCWITNQGPLSEELESKLKDFLNVKNLLLVSNGTIALQLAIKALGLKGEIITTPYSYVATTNSIIWENCVPVFCDIESKTFCIDPDLIESKITENTSAIMATHVYGFPCDVEKIKSVADKHNLKIIYDGAHAFGVKYKNESLLNFGDISTVSFHATKLFHTIEGGAVICRDENISEKIFLYRAFGHLDDEYYTIGINGRTSEFNAAMGLCNLPGVNDFILERKKINLLYRECLNGSALGFPVIPGDIEYNYSYFPVFFSSGEKMHEMKNILYKNGINARRYFYPSLNKLPFLSTESCPVSERTASCVLCLPVFNGMSADDIKFISDVINKNIHI